MSEARQMVYVIGPGEAGPVKIGVAVDPKSRLRELRTGSHLPLDVLLTFDPEPHSAISVERACHRLLRDKNLIREWFAVTCSEAGEVIAAEIAKPSRPAPDAIDHEKARAFIRDLDASSRSRFASLAVDIGAILALPMQADKEKYPDEKLMRFKELAGMFLEQERAKMEDHISSWAEVVESFGAV